jgi:hypothetical protein
MKAIMKKLTQTCRLVPVAGLAALFGGLVGVHAQWLSVPATDPMAQRNARNLVLNQIKWFQSTTRTAGSYVGGGYGNLVQQYQAVGAQWASFKATLTPQQSDASGNEVAELDAGLEIIGEAFTDYQTAAANGQSEVTALNNLRRVLNQAMAAWGQQFNRTCRQLRAGW